MKVRKGTYVLFIRLGKSLETEVGSLGVLKFPKGTYCYVGSAMAGLDQRLGRHFSAEKTIKWHVDRLTVNAEKIYAYESSGEFIPECALGKILEECGAEPYADGFGSSDCNCRSHLFRVSPKKAENALSEKGLKKFSLSPNRARHENSR